jgi:hypothetical protein
MTSPSNDIEAFAVEMENLLQRRCAERGFEFEQVRHELKFKWYLEEATLRAEQTRAKNAPLEAILARALAFRKQGDQAGYHAACQDWLLAKHGVKIGDTVRLGGYMKERTILIEDFEINLKEENQSVGGSAHFTGPCLSHKIRNTVPNSHIQALNDFVGKVIV